MPSSPESYDGCITLAAPGGAPKGLQSTGNAQFAVPSSLLGVPALTLPLFKLDGMPLGLQVLGFFNEDARAFAIAGWLRDQLSEPLMDDRARQKLHAALDRYRDGAPANARSYPDLHEHVLALARDNLLVVVDEPINKDTEMHPLVRWQYRGGIPEPDRKAFLFTQPTDSKGRRYDTAVLVAGLAANRAVYRTGFGKPLEDIGAVLGQCHRQSDPAARGRERAVPGDRDHRQGPRQGRPGARRTAGADLDAGLGQRALSLGRSLHHQGSRQRRAERRQLPRPAQGAASASA